MWYVLYTVWAYLQGLSKKQCIIIIRNALLELFKSFHNSFTDTMNDQEVLVFMWVFDSHMDEMNIQLQKILSCRDYISVHCCCNILFTIFILQIKSQDYDLFNITRCAASCCTYICWLMFILTRQKIPKQHKNINQIFEKL